MWRPNLQAVAQNRAPTAGRHITRDATEELKAHSFKPEHTGQLNFYLSAVDAQIKASDDAPTIGILLCRTQNRMVAEYALSGIEKPIGVAEYQLVRALPEPLDTTLPSIEEIEAQLSRDLEVEAQLD